MAILRSLDGKFYEIADAELGDFELAPDRLKEVLGPGEDPGPDDGPGDAPQVVIEIHGQGADVDPGPPPQDGGAASQAEKPETKPETKGD